MPFHAAKTPRKVSKSTLSMFLRTRCDKELFLSLHHKETMGTAGLPAPAKRPGIGVLAVLGKEFETERNDQLVRLFPSIIKFNKGSKSYSDIDLESSLLGVTSPPAILLQGKFSITTIKSQILQNIGLSVADISDVPDIADFIPDVLVVREPRDRDFAIRPDGSRELINNFSETRLAIDIIDVKHTSEANPSYCAEIALYALFLTNWLHHHPKFKDRYYVSTTAYLWTRFKQGDSELDRLEHTGGATIQLLLDALITDSEDASLRSYLPAVRRFFEDVVRVLRIGDASLEGWTDLEWHVRSTCVSCDWLGDKRHLGKAEKNLVDANPSHYCIPAARTSGHLCLVPGITRGAKKTLEKDTVLTTNDLAAAAGHPALQKHMVLKREARSLPARSAAILSGSLSNDHDVAIASLAGSAHLLLYASVNFDSSSGLLTGLALSGVATIFTKGQSPKRFKAMPYVVDQKTLEAEWVALEAFLGQIADCLNQTEVMLGGNPTGQIHFWEERQFKELCNAMGRHLPHVLALTERKAKALAWVFPPEELLPTPESLEASTVVTVEDIVRRMIFAPTPHVISLFDTAEHYPSGPVQTVYDSYYREYLSDGVPRERIYEIWSNADPIKRGTTNLPRNTIIHQYSDVLAKQSKALESICERLRKDYKGHFKAKATRIPSAIPGGAKGVAFDGKLWIWWDKLGFNTSQLEAHIRLSMDGERLEATYEAIILKNGKPVSSEVYEFDVTPGSTESKFKEDSRLTLGKLGRPGFPLEHAAALLPSTAPPFPGSQRTLSAPLWSVLTATLVRFDRVNAKAWVKLSSYQEPQFVPYLVANSTENLLTDVFLLEAKSPSSFDWSRVSTKILKEIGNPAIAVPDQNAAEAMGIKPKSRHGGKDPVTPAARVLWDASTLNAQAVTSSSEAKAIGDYVTERYNLNSSQTVAIECAAEHALTIIWGPPGTGKTNTLAALLDGLTQEAASHGRSLKALVTGPTYKSVEQVMCRTAKDFLAHDPTARASMYMCYSPTRPFGPIPADLPNHVSYTRMKRDDLDIDYKRCLTELSSGSGVIILGCQITQARRFTEAVMGSLVQPLFDVVIIDESSQVPVSQALSALCGLKNNARLIIAGDHLQMPPISSIEPPIDAEYLVGSIQAYLLERTFSDVVKYRPLEKNYRSAKDIVAFGRSIGYPSSLDSVYPDTALHQVNPLQSRSAYPPTLPWCAAFNELLAPRHKVVTLLHEDEISSQGNQFEARLVAGCVWMLRHSVSAALDGRDAVTHSSPSTEVFWSECIGVVTPHRAQRALVIRELEQLFPGEKTLIDDAVDTVERFQGGERHTIIVTYGVADTDVMKGEEAFLMQRERTNVAISRAMAKCIVIMPKTLAEYIPEDKRALETSSVLKNYVEEYCNIRIDTTIYDSMRTRWGQLRYHNLNNEK